MACSTCHDPAKAHAQDNDLAVQSGGAELATPGFRAVPSLRYMNMNSPFFFASDGTPTGGFARDVNMSEAPYNRRPGQPPALSGAEIDDAVAFLKTLTDGYDPITDTADPARDVPKDQ